MNMKTSKNEKETSARVGSATGSALADVALIVCKAQAAGHVWYGNPQLCQDIYSRAGRTAASHPLNQIAAVVSACARSKKWRRNGYIKHLGRKYPLFEPNAEISNERHEH